MTTSRSNDAATKSAAAADVMRATALAAKAAGGKLARLGADGRSSLLPPAV